MSNKKLIIQKMENIYQILNELQYSAMEQLVGIQKNQRRIIDKIDKLQEYNEIDDMNNALVNRKLNVIENKIF